MLDLIPLLEKQKNKKLLVVFPHPDDETMASGGLLYEAKKMGYETWVITLTKGDKGECHVAKHGRTLEQIRTAELTKACRKLAVDHLVLKDFGDATLRKHKARWSAWLATQLAEIDPGVVVTYDHSGSTGHPDHIVLSLEVKRLLAAEKFTGVLLWPVLHGVWRKRLYRSDLAEFYAKPDYALRMGWGGMAKFLASQAHKSQFIGEWHQRLLYFTLVNKEWYHKVKLAKDYPHKFVEFDI